MMFVAHLTLALTIATSAVASPAQWGTSSQDVYDNLGNLSPYHSAEVPSGIKAGLPSDCKVDQVLLMGRHGSRYPLGSELTSVTGLVSALANASKAITKAKLPDALQFLKAGYVSTLGTNDLTAPGRQELFDAGVKYRLRYPHLNATHVLAGGQDRVIESAQWFANGYFGRSWSSLNATAFSTIAEDSVTESWITPMDTCKAWDYNYGNNLTVAWDQVYIPPIAARLNKLIPGMNFTTDNVHGALYACAYDYAAHRASPWCAAFTKQELADFEYELDLLMWGAFSYGLPGAMGPTLGSLYVQHLVQTFSNASAPGITLEFGHDTTIDMVLTSLGLAHDKSKLPARGPVPASRAFRTSQQVPFGAQMVWEKFSCASSFSGPQIRLVLNDATLPLPACVSGASKKYGTCALADFVKANKAALGVQWMGQTWNASCSP